MLDLNLDLEHIQLIVYASSIVRFPLEPAHVRDVNNLGLLALVFLRPVILALYIAAACLLPILVPLLFPLAVDENEATQHNLRLVAYSVFSLRRYT